MRPVDKGLWGEGDVGQGYGSGGVGACLLYGGSVANGREEGGKGGEWV